MWDACSIVLLSVCCLERRQDQCVLVAGHLPVSTCGGIGPCDTPSSHHPGTQPGPGGSKEFWSRLRLDSRLDSSFDVAFCDLWSGAPPWWLFVSTCSSNISSFCPLSACLNWEGIFLSDHAPCGHLWCSLGSGIICTSLAALSWVSYSSSLVRLGVFKDRRKTAS